MNRILKPVLPLLVALVLLIPLNSRVCSGQQPDAIQRPSSHSDSQPELSIPNFGTLLPVGGTWVCEDGILSAAANGPAKAMLDLQDVSHFELNFEVRVDSTTQAGVIFNVADPGVGLDQFRGYYTGIDPRTGKLIAGRVQQQWRPLADRNLQLKPDQWYHFRIRAEGSNFRVWMQDRPVAEGDFPQINGTDGVFESGQVGFRILGRSASFRNLQIQRMKPQPPPRSWVNPIQANVADPAVLLHEGMYYLYCTHSADHPNMPRGIRMYRSQDLVHWEDLGFAITRERSWGSTRFWAPDILFHQGKFYLYYAVDTRICVATATSPTGPFRQLGKMPMVPDSIRIDAHVYRDEDEKLYFYYVAFNDGNEIRGAELANDMISLKPGTDRLLLQADQPWEVHGGRIVEGPVILKHDQTYFLTYSGSHFESPQYAVGYATSNNPLGPWKKHTSNPIMKSAAWAHGTAHHCFASSRDGSELFIVYHRHFNLTQTEPRQLAIDRAGFLVRPGRPTILQIEGPTSSPQPFPSR